MTGPREPLFFVPGTPDVSDDDISTPIDNENGSSVSDSDPEEGMTTVSFANKLYGQPKPFKFRSLSELNKKPSVSPSSSPIPLPSEDTFIISSENWRIQWYFLRRKYHRKQSNGVEHS